MSAIVMRLTITALCFRYRPDRQLTVKGQMDGAGEERGIFGSCFSGKPSRTVPATTGQPGDVTAEWGKAR